MKKLKIFIIIILVIILMPFIINFYVIISTKENIYNIDKINNTYDIALVLGCSVLNSTTPSKMLRDRLDTAIDLYERKIVDKILISGDHNSSYSEVEVMNYYLINNNILKEDILIDYKGYSTSESLINYKNNYSDKSLIIVTQKYHLYRALYISQDLELNGVGVHAKLINYDGYIFREIREILARNKDFLVFLFK